MVQHVPGGQENDRHNPHRRWDPQRTTNPEPAEQIGVVGKAGIYRASIGIHHRHAAQQQHHDQRSDKCLHAPFRHNHAGHGADSRA